MKIGTNLGNFKKGFSLKKALSKTYEVKGRKGIYKSGKHKGKVTLCGFLTFPQILIGHKIKLVLIK